MTKTAITDTPILVANGQLDAELQGDLPVLMIVWNGESLRSDLQAALKTAAKEHAGKLRVLKVDTSHNPDLAQRFDLGKHPLLIGWHGGEERARRSRPWGADVAGIAAELAALVPSDAPEQPAEDHPVEAGKPVHVTDATFADLVLKSKLPVIVDFWAAWCQPCKMVAPILDKLAAEFAGQVRIAKVDVDANPMLSQQFQIRSIPTLMFVKNGKIVGQSAGAAPEAALRDVIRQLIALQV